MRGEEEEEEDGKVQTMFDQQSNISKATCRQSNDGDGMLEIKQREVQKEKLQPGRNEFSKAISVI